MVRQRALELIACDARLYRRGCRDQIGDRFRLHEIPLPVEKRTERKFPGFGKSGPDLEGSSDNRPKHDRISMRTDLDDMLAGVGMGCWKVRDDDFVDHARALPDQSGERRATSLEWFAAREHGCGDFPRRRSADPNDADAPSARWRRDRYDGVVGGEHPP